MADHEISAEPTQDKGGSTASVADRLSSVAYIPRAWLVVLGLLIGTVIVVSLWEPRWWRGIQDALFATEGQIIVSSPAVYTRQRLVNDRLSQTSWLQDQLKVTDGLDTAFRGIDEMRTDTNSSATRIAAGIKKAPTIPQSASGETATNSNPVQDRQDTGAQNAAPINPTSADLFRMKNTYREEVRAEIMETQLDDRHDIKGNTIYRLSFDATILPGLAADALAVIKVTVKHNYEKVIWDYVELYNDWMRRMQSTVAKSIDEIALQFEDTSTRYAYQADCRYFGVCGGGAPANKMMENGSLATSETLFCRLSVQSAADALLAFLSTAADKPAHAHWLDAARAEQATLN